VKKGKGLVEIISTGFFTFSHFHFHFSLKKNLSISGINPSLQFISPRTTNLVLSEKGFYSDKFSKKLDFYWLLSKLAVYAPTNFLIGESACDSYDVYFLTLKISSAQVKKDEKFSSQICSCGHMFCFNFAFGKFRVCRSG